VYKLQFFTFYICSFITFLSYYSLSYYSITFGLPSQIIRFNWNNDHANQFLVFFHLNFLFDST